MSTKHMISPGIGFSPGSIKYIVTRGLIAGPAIVVVVELVTPNARIFQVQEQDRVFEVPQQDRVFEVS